MQAILQTKGIHYAMDIVGGQDKYQHRVVCLLISQLLFRAFFMAYYPFITRSPTFSCKDPETGLLYDCTELTGGCEEQILSPNSPNSLSVELGFYCENGYVKTLASTLFFVGGNFGAAYFSYLSDQKGRKISLLASYILGSLSLVLLGTVAVGPWTYILFIMMIWAAFSSYASISLTYIAEVSNERFGKKAIVILLLGTAILKAIIVFLAMVFESWRILFLVCIAAPAVLTNLTFLALDESPTFHTCKKQFAKAAEILKKIGKVNKIASNEIMTPVEEKDHDTAPCTPNNLIAKPARTWNYGQIITHPKLQRRVLIYSIIKLYLCMVFYGCLFAISSLGGSIYTNSLLAILGEILGFLLSFKAHIFANKALLRGSLQIIIFTGIGFLLIPTISTESFFLLNPLFLQGALALVAIIDVILRTAICFVFGFIFNFGNELFPPEVRCQSTGISEIFSALGGMIAPFIIVAAEVLELSPLFLFGTMGLLILSSIRFLPEGPLLSMDDNHSIEMGQMTRRSRLEEPLLSC